MADADPGERRVLLAVMLGACLAPLNSTMLLVALPEVLDDFSADLSSGGWLITSYLIAVAALQTPAGKLGDRIGHRRVFAGGLVAFMAATAAAAAAPNLPALIAFRMSQGVAIAGVFPNGWAMLRRSVPPGRLASRFAVVGSVLSVSVAVGPPLSGVLVDLGGWRSVFLINLAVAGPALVLARRIREVPVPERVGAYDLAGALGWGALLVATAGLLNVSTHGAGSPLLLAVGLALVAGAGVALVRRALRHPDPVLQPRFFIRPAFAAASAGIGFGNLAWYLTFIVVPLVLKERPGATGLRTGLVLSASALLFVVLVPLGGRLADRLGRRRPAVAGMSLFVAGLVPLPIAGAGIALPLLVACLMVTGAGFALATPAMQAAALDAVRPEESGAASGVYATSRYLGSILGSSLLAAAGDPTGRTVFAMLLAGGVAAALSVTRL
ncbi:MAG: MFS transporter, partial [Acidimicrobiia bacterium]